MLLICIVASVIVVALESVSTLPIQFDLWLYGLEWFFTIIFTFDYIARLWIVKRKGSISLASLELLTFFPFYQRTSDYSWLARNH